MNIKVTGMKNIARRMNAKGNSMSRNLGLGLKVAGTELMQTSKQMAPLEFGDLRKSAYTKLEPLASATIVTVGYSAPYAVKVHESVGMRLQGQPRKGVDDLGRPHKGRFWDPQGKAQAKFLEAPFRAGIHNIIQRVAEKVSIK